MNHIYTFIVDNLLPFLHFRVPNSMYYRVMLWFIDYDQNPTILRNDFFHEPNLFKIVTTPCIK